MIETISGSYLLLSSNTSPTFDLGLEDPSPLDSPFGDLTAQEPKSLVLLTNLADQLTMIDLRRFVHRACRLLEPGGQLIFAARSPEQLARHFPERPWPGEMHQGNRYRPLRQYLELLRLFPCFHPFLKTVGSTGGDSFLLFSTRKMKETSLEKNTPDLTLDEKYGASSTYRRFQRLEEPEILDDLLHAYSRLRPQAGDKILSLGVNDGSELALFHEITSADLVFHGIDGSASAIKLARRRFPENASTFRVADLNRIDTLDLPDFQIVLLLNTLQCRTIDREALLSQMKPLLAPDARILISLPNCHFSPGDILRRPIDRKDPANDRSPTQKTLRYLARHFYRLGFTKIEAFGTYDAFLLIQ